MSIDMALMIDIALLALLAVAVYFGYRLTSSLRNFREGRHELEDLVARLSTNVTQAEQAVAGMQATARKVGLELDEIINDARGLADELKIMNKAGDNLADRLEKLAEKNRTLATEIEEAGANASKPIMFDRGLPKSIQPDFEERDDVRGAFAIRDRDYDRVPEREHVSDVDDDLALEAELSGGGFQSQAERELFQALQSGKARHKGGRA